jgi:FlaA1/EpsC-like NDP-sugar epimerase
LFIYALLPETSRFSRAVTIFGAVWTAIAMNAIRYLLHSSKLKGYRYANPQKRKILIIGSRSETEKASMIAQTGSQKPETIYTMEDRETSIIKDFIENNRVNELILCSKDVTIKNIISHFIALKSSHVICKIAPENAQTIIGSRRIQQPREIAEIPN